MHGLKRSGIRRGNLTSPGPWFECNADGHDKLGALGLDFDGLGFPIYAFKDKFSRYILHIRVMPNNRTEQAIAMFAIDFLRKWKCKFDLLSK